MSLTTLTVDQAIRNHRRNMARINGPRCRQYSIPVRLQLASASWGLVTAAYRNGGAV